MAKPPQYDPDRLQREIRGWSQESARHLSSRVEVPAEFEAELTHPEWPCGVRLYVVVSPERGPFLSGARAMATGSVPVNVREALDLVKGLGQPINILLTTLTAQATAARVTIAMAGQVCPDDPQLKEKLSVLLEARNGLADLVWPTVRPRRRRLVTSEFLREVATVYRKAWEAGRPPTVAVAEHFKTSHSTATRWVTQARKAGELGPAQGTRAGEASTPSK